MMTTWLICGGRDYTDAAEMDVALWRLIGKIGRPNKIVHGAARGADSLAGEWGERNGFHVVAVPADWKAHGRAAGPLRNQKMLDEHKPDLVVAFPGGRGTEDKVRRAKEAGVRVARMAKEGGL